MSTAMFVEALIEYQMQIEDAAISATPEVKSRFAEILKDPEQMNDELAIQFLEAEMALTDLDESFWDTVADGLDLGFMGLLGVPIDERGEAWDMAQQLVVAISQRQAVLESSAIIEAIKAGADYGKGKGLAAKGVDLAELQSNNKFKSMIKAKRNALQNG